MFVIRLSGAEDIPHIYSMIRDFAVFQQTPEKVSVTPEQMLADKDLFRCFVAENEQGEIIGFASFYFTYFSWSGRGLYLDDLYVKEAYRKQHAGSSLLNAVIDLAKKERCKKVRWQVSNWNKNAIDFYKKMGAVVDDTEINCDLTL